MSFDTGLYSSRQSGSDTMSRRGFHFAIASYTAMFIAVAAFGSSFTYDLVIENPWLFLLFVIVCMVVSIGGATLAHSNDDPMTSVFGGFICAAAMGAMVGPFVAMFEQGSVVRAFLLAGGIVMLTGFIGAVMPHDLSSWGAPLMGGLLGAIVLTLATPLLGLFGIDYRFAMTLVDWGVIILFMLIMMYDLNKAQQLDRTHNNAVDVAVNVFLNFANLFIRLLSVMGQRK